jgi:hypothetical protein
MRVHRGEVRAMAAKLLQWRTFEVLQLYEHVLPSLVPTATHPDLWKYEESSAEWAARVGANEWEQEDDGDVAVEAPTT